MGSSPSKNARKNNYHFRSGRPQFTYTSISPMFNQMLYRLANSETNQWALYNDSPDLVVHAAVLFDYDSQIVPLGNTTAFRIDDPDEGNEDDFGKYLCEVDVPPGGTELFVEGMITGWRVDTLEARTSANERIYRL